MKLLDVVQQCDVWWHVAFLCHCDGVPTDGVCVATRRNGLPFAYTNWWDFEAFISSKISSKPTVHGELTSLGLAVVSTHGPEKGWIYSLCMDRHCGDEVGVLWSETCTMTSGAKQEIVYIAGDSVKAGKRRQFDIRLHPSCPYDIPDEVSTKIAQSTCRNRRCRYGYYFRNGA